MQQVDDPPFLSVGTEVSAKYKGAFCEAKVRKVVRNIKCKVAYKQGLGSGTVSDDLIKGALRVGAVVEVKHPDKRDYVEATITKIQDCSQYTVVFDDGDITTLRRTALCLKSGRHFNESETLDQLPLTHPEHFGNPVIGGRRGRRSRHLQDDSSDEDDDRDSKEVVNEKEEHIGKVVCVESTDTKKKDKDKWFPGLVVSPTAQVTVRIRVKDEYLVRSFKDGRYYTVPKKEAMEFTRELAAKQEGPAVQAALQYLDHDTLPTHWDRDALFGLANSSSEYEGEFDSDSSDDEPREEKDHFVAQLYKFMDDRGTPINKGPTITNRDVDLYRLFRAVQKLGGYNRVTSQNQWKAITLRLGFCPATISVTNLVKQAYKKFLQPFEEFDRKLGCSMTMTPRTNRSKGRSLVRANSVASPKPEVKEPKILPPTAEESENTSESSVDAAKSKRKLSTASGKVKIMIEKYEEKVKEETEAQNKSTKAPKDEQQSPVQLPVSSSSTTKKEKHAKKQSQMEEKRGRKKKDTESSEKVTEKVDGSSSSTDFPVDVGDKLKVYYHEKKVTYEAKVIEISMQQGTPLYLVHYTGWNTRYDEWVPRERIAENLTTSKTKRMKGSSSSKSTTSNTVPPNEGGKVTPGNNSEKSSMSIMSSSTPTSASKVSGSKRGRGRSDSQPPRSTTPSSGASTVSRTKSPAASLTQRRTTRRQPSTARRTSNNVSDISLQTDSDTDSDEPVKKPTRTSATTPSTSSHQMTSTPGAAKSGKSVTPNSQSETEDEDVSLGPKGRDYDLNQIRSELKGFKELKSPSPEPEVAPSSTNEDKASVFDFNLMEENEPKPPPITTHNKPSMSVTESKSSTDLSSETDSFGDDDSQSSDKTTTLENMTEKFQQKIKAEKLAQAKCLERLGPGKANEKILSIKSSGIEKIIKDTLAEKYQETLKTKPFSNEPNTFTSMENEDPQKPEAVKPPTKLLSGERKASTAIEKKLSPVAESKLSVIRTEKFLEKSQAMLKLTHKELLISDVSLIKPATIIPEKLVKEIAKPLSQIKPSTADIYEFKEPEPFEFESRKVPAVPMSSLEIDKKQKKISQKPVEVSTLEIISKPTPSLATTAKKNKKSPVKEPEKAKQVKIEEKEKAPTPESKSPINVLLSPTKIDATFDALRKSPSFNLSLSTLSDDSSSASDTMKPASTSTEKGDTNNPNKASSPPPLHPSSAPLPKIVPFISPFMETPKCDTANVFDLKADVENIDSDNDNDSLLGSKTGLETVKKILLADPDFDLEPPKIEKPSIADKVLKALSQQKQEEANMKEDPPKTQVIEAPQITSFPITEPPKIELPLVIKKEIELPLKKPILSSPEHKNLDILESIAPKNNDLSETIQKLESAIQKTSTVDHFDEDSSDSTDSERRLVIEDDSQSSECNIAENVSDLPSTTKKIENTTTEKEIRIELEVKDESNFFTNKFPPSIFGMQPSGFPHDSLLADPDVKPIIEMLPFKPDNDPNNKTDLKVHIPPSLIEVKKEEPVNSNQENTNINSESINLLLCEETIPGSPTPMKECQDIKPNLHPTESDIKPVPMDIETGPITSTVEIIPQPMPKSHNNTPNSSPRDSLSLDDSSEDLKKHHEQGNEISPKKRRRTRKHSEAESVTKRRRATVSVSKRANGSDSDDNSDHNNHRSSTRGSKPCQYNFLVQLDPALSPNQRITILKKKIQELRKTYNLIKVELASIDRRRKKLRRREREKKNQQKLAS